MLREAIEFDRHGDPHPVPVDRSGMPVHLRRARRRRGFLWIEAWQPDAGEMEWLADLLGLDRRSALEASDGRQQPKIRHYDSHLTVVVWTLEFRTTHPRVAIGQVFLYVSRDALLTVRRARPADDETAGSRLGTRGTRIPGGALGAAFSILEDLVADYASLTDEVEDELEEIERQVYDDAIVENRTHIYALRQQIGKIDRAVSSLARALEVSRPHLASVSVAGRQVEPYVEDLLDMLSGTASLLRDQSSTLDAVVASHENNAASRQNDDTRRISAIAALLSVPALTAGIYGMNFQDLPLVDTALGWAYVVGAAVLIDAVAIVFFRRRGWL